MSPLHVLPQKLNMPMDRDPVGNSVEYVRRKKLRPQSSWELEVPGKQELLDPIWGLLEYAQGDRAIWFDGAGFGEVTEPILVGEGDGVVADFNLPHQYVFIASLIVYSGGSVITTWSPLGGDGVSTCSSIHFVSAPASNIPIMAKYRRKIKTLLNVEQDISRSRLLRSYSSPSDTIHSLKLTLTETAS
jgi:hypothetical protein